MTRSEAGMIIGCALLAGIVLALVTQTLWVLPAVCALLSAINLGAAYLAGWVSERWS